MLFVDWTKQPAGEDARLRSKLGITGVFVANLPQNVATGYPISLGSGPRIIRTPIEPDLGLFLSTTTNDWAQFEANANNLFPDNARCTIAILRRSLNTTAVNSTLFGYNTSTTDRVQIHAPFGDGNLYFDFGSTTTGAGGGRVSGAFTKSTNRETLVFVADSTRGREVWRNGSLIISSTAPNQSRPSNTSAVRIGSVGSTGADSEYIFLCVVSKLAWSPAQIVKWSRAARQYAETWEPRLVAAFPTAAATFQAAWARGANSVLGTGARAQ